MSERLPEPASTPIHRPRRGSALLSLLREIAIVVVIALVLSAVVRTFLVQAFFVPSRSMEETLLVDDRIIASKITTRFSGVDRGEVVVFRDPGEWLSAPIEPTGMQAVMRTFFVYVGLLPARTGDDLVKRVIGIGGDVVICCDSEGRITVNGYPLEEPYLPEGERTDQVAFEVTVPPRHMFVMGDNRSDSEDSRFHLDLNDGAVPVDDVVGRVVLRIWPLDRFAPLRTPRVFEQVPAAGAAAGVQR
jgi:signal peptidase I